MRIENENTDAAILAELGERLAQARLARNLKQEDLALASGLSKHTVERLETGRSVQLSNFIRVLRGLKLAQNLDPLIPDSAPSPLAQLKLRKKQRRRASSPRKSKPATDLWTWGDKP
jgi:transcriptional regulator with XRE-family HTH domain